MRGRAGLAARGVAVAIVTVLGTSLTAAVTMDTAQPPPTRTVDVDHALGLIAALGPVDAYLLVTNSAYPVKGEGSQAPNAIAIHDYAFGIENSSTIGSASSGAGAGKATFQEFTVTKSIDSSTTALFKTVAIGAHFDKAELILKKSGAAPAVVFTFGTVAVKKIEFSGSAGEEPQEKVTFLFGQMTISYTKVGATGTPTGPPSNVTWDQILNKAS